MVEYLAAEMEFLTVEELVGSLVVLMAEKTGVIAAEKWVGYLVDETESLMDEPRGVPLAVEKVR